MKICGAREAAGPLFNQSSNFQFSMFNGFLPRGLIFNLQWLPSRGLASLPPEPRAASYSELVRDDLHVRVELEVYSLRVSAADVQPVEMRQSPQSVNRTPHASVPGLLTDLLASLVADLLVVVLVFAKGKMSD